MTQANLPVDALTRDWTKPFSAAVSSVVAKRFGIDGPLIHLGGLFFGLMNAVGVIILAFICK
jgi:hypothetical protein